ncbi:MAG: DUF1186 domain-containing protein [bacterium]|nr:DUF1186 domain-containing protein [bacterium]
MNENEITIETILDSFSRFDGIYKQYEVEEAIKRQEEITPHLIRILQDVLGNPNHYIEDDPDYYGDTYALMLLGYFKEVSAHDVIIKLFSLPGEIPFDLYDDIVTEDLEHILYATSGGNWDGIREMIENPAVNEFCRCAAMETLTFFVVSEEVKREEIIQYLVSLYPKLIEEDPFPEVLLSTFTNVAVNIYPEELMDIIDKAYEEEFVSTLFMTKKNIETTLEAGKEKVLENTRKRLKRRFPDNFHNRMSWWHCFKADNRYNKSGSKILYSPTEKNKAKRNRKKKK